MVIKLAAFDKKKKKKKASCPQKLIGPSLEVWYFPDFLAVGFSLVECGQTWYIPLLGLAHKNLHCLLWALPHRLDVGDQTTLGSLLQSRRRLHPLTITWKKLPHQTEHLPRTDNRGKKWTSLFADTSVGMQMSTSLTPFLNLLFKFKNKLPVLSRVKLPYILEMSKDITENSKWVNQLEWSLGKCTMHYYLLDIQSVVCSSALLICSISLLRRMSLWFLCSHWPLRSCAGP